MFIFTVPPTGDALKKQKAPARGTPENFPELSVTRRRPGGDFKSAVLRFAPVRSDGM